MSDEGWKRSSFCSNSACIEVRRVYGLVSVRHADATPGMWLTFTVEEWAAFLAGAKAGEFDD